MRKLLTERDVLNALKRKSRQIIISPDGIVTPAAADTAKVKNILIVRSPHSSTLHSHHNSDSSGISRVVLGCDHGGFTLKTELLSFLDNLGYTTEDVGTYSTEPVDYPDYAYQVAQRVASDAAVVGIVIDGAGVGSAMAANKVAGIRAAACYDIHTAKNSREHNYANVLTLGSRMTTPAIAKEVVRVWLQTPYGEERHKLRVDKIMQIEAGHHSR